MTVARPDARTSADQPTPIVDGICHPAEVTVQNQPPPTISRRSIVLLVLGVAALAAVLSVGTFVLLRGSDNGPAGAGTVGTAPSTTAATATLDAKTACVQATHLLTDATTEVQSMIDHPDGSATTVAHVEDTIAGLRNLEPSMPGHLGSDLDDVVAVLQQIRDVLRGGGTVTLELSTFKSRVPGVILACGQYVTPTAG